MLIANAEICGEGVADLRIENGSVAAIGQLDGRPEEEVLDQGGAAVLPGLNDHHIHLMAYAAALDSVACGPPRVESEEGLIDALARATPGSGGWIRGIGYHESVAGDIDRFWLDAVCPDVPVRVQHRSGRLWIVNGAGLDRLARAATRGTSVGERSGLARIRDELAAADANAPAANAGDGRGSVEVERGRFFDLDDRLRGLWGGATPPVAAASRRLASYGVTGLTDLTPGNGTADAEGFDELRSSGRLLQRIRVGGKAEMRHALAGPTKVHLHESSLPDYDGLCGLIGQSHARGREVAMHCVTETELVFALAAFRDAGTVHGDRIEHASVAPPALLGPLRDLGLLVVTQPHFVAERGDAYLRDLPEDEHTWLYRCRGFLDRGIPLAGGSDAPFGHADPWRAMRAAVERQTASGRPLGPREALSPEQALSLYLGSLEQPERERRIAVGAAADLCLLDRPWRAVRMRLDSACVTATVQAGRFVYRRGDRVNPRSRRSAPIPVPVSR